MTTEPARGIKTGAAAELLGVSPSTLRSWEQRLGFPHARRSAGNQRSYDVTELETLREALVETRNISSAIELARRRGRGLSSPARLLRALDAFDEAAADRTMEESLAVRTVERTLDELLLPALAIASDRRGQEVELEHACRWAIGWLYSARRLTPAATREEAVLLLDSSNGGANVEAVQTQALELVLRRAGLRALLLSAGLAESRFDSALRALRPSAVVLCGPETRLDTAGPAVRAVQRRRAGTKIFGFRAARLVNGREGVPTLGNSPSAATDRLLSSLG